MRKLSAHPKGTLAIAMATTAVILAGTGVALASSSGHARASTAGHAASSENVDFRGVWGSPPSGWHVLTENLATGACTGTTDFGGLYTFTGCQVTGNSYVFVINYGLSYHSYDSGTITGNAVQGQFHDTNGTVAPVGAFRSPSPTNTKITAKPVKAKRGKAITYTVHVTSAFGTPPGNVQVMARSRLLCTASLNATGTGSCKTTKTPVGTREVITAAHRGSALPPFSGSKGTVRVTITK